MSDRRCPGCEVRIIRGDPLLSSCEICKRVFHQLCRAVTAPGTPLACANCAAPPSAVPGSARLREVSGTDALPPTTPTPLLLPTTGSAAHSAAPTSSSLAPTGPEPPQSQSPITNQHTLKRRASTPSPSITPLPKAHRSSHADTVDCEEQEQSSRTPTPFPELDADGSFRATLQTAPPYMQVFYNMLKSSHDTTTAALAENARVMANTTSALTNLSSRIDELTSRVTVTEQDHRALNERLDTGFAVMRADISRIDAAIREPLSQSQRSLEDPCEIVVREIPLAVQLEPLQLAASLLNTIKLPPHAPLVVGWRAWNPPARSGNPEHADPAAAALVPVRLRAFVFTLACPAARDDVLRKTPGLRNLDCQTIFGAGGGAKLSVNALWPDPIHKLLKHAMANHRTLGHLRPLVKNMVVFMRPSRNAPLIPVASEADVDALVSAKANATAAANATA